MWTAGVFAEGYGNFGISNRNGVVAHRFAYEITIGPLNGLELDHECHNKDLTCKPGKNCPHRRCVNPSHLLPRPNGEHQKLGWENWRRRRALTNPESEH